MKEAGLNIMPISGELNIPTWEELPAIDLYIDQVTILINSYLAPFNTGTKPMLTSTMVNNYVKAKIIPPPVKKKYSRDTVSLLFVVVTLKTMFNIQEIGELILHVTQDHPIHEAYNIYRRMLIRAVNKVFSGEAPISEEPDEEKLQLTENVCLGIAYQMYVKFRLAEARPEIQHLEEE